MSNLDSERPHKLNRRELLTPWKRKPVLAKSNITEGHPASAPVMSRREFIKFLGLLAGSTISAQYIVNPSSAEAKVPSTDVVGNKPKIVSEYKASTKKLSDKKEKTAEDKLLLFGIEGKDAMEVPGLKKTVIETTLLHVAERIAVPILKQLNVPIGNPRSEEIIQKMLEENTLEFLIANAVVLSPLIEEVLYRLAPGVVSMILTKEISWNIGVPTSAIFALTHNITSDEKGSYKFHTDTIPLGQFVGGLFFWYLMRERGILHPFVGHSLHNAEAILVSKLLLKAFPPRNKGDKHPAKDSP